MAKLQDRAAGRAVKAISGAPDTHQVQTSVSLNASFHHCSHSGPQQRGRGGKSIKEVTAVLAEMTMIP